MVSPLEHDEAINLVKNYFSQWEGQKPEPINIIIEKIKK